MLSPLLFLIVVDTLLKDLRHNEAGLSLLGLFVGGAAHADDIRTIATSTSQISSQVSIINDFTSRNSLKVNSSKTEIVRISRQPFLPEQIELSPTNIITTLPVAKCLEHGGAIISLHSSLFKRTFVKLERPSLPLGKLRPSRVT